MRAKSAVDRRFRAVVFGVIVFLFAAAVLFTTAISFAPYQIVIGCGAVLAASAFLLWLLYGTFYELRDDYLYCRSGPFVEKIGYDQIKYLGYSENMLSSMALSSKRIEIRQYGKGFVNGTIMISPENREIFLGYLRQRCHCLDKAS
ncbi:PH domain-containing protein [Sporobacter termitidis DSM 10068]|uniref:PH domain-containing protein n=1 Tax=Sporobacter termitidis DSM 10068 TaxID=1123282 RepID=A0A1M5WVS3_9FIRM|nr:PH domain-containing protein [Sporobacter termitidis]SHH91512.1 PH domain-containing protein [Sporobacter termitidis DSM 10068]